jgi:hypothetical protein
VAAATTRLDLLHDQDAGGQLATSSETNEVEFVAPAQLDSLNIHPSMRLRIDHYFERRSAPYIG